MSNEYVFYRVNEMAEISWTAWEPLQSDNMSLNLYDKLDDRATLCAS